MVPWVVLAQIIYIYIFRKLSNFQKWFFPKIFYFWVKGSEESFEIFLNISFLKINNQK